TSPVDQPTASLPAPSPRCHSVNSRRGRPCEDGGRRSETYRARSGLRLLGLQLADQALAIVDDFPGAFTRLTPTLFLGVVAPLIAGEPTRELRAADLRFAERAALSDEVSHHRNVVFGIQEPLFLATASRGWAAQRIFGALARTDITSSDLREPIVFPVRRNGARVEPALVEDDRHARQGIEVMLLGFVLERLCDHLRSIGLDRWLAQFDGR